MSNSRFLFVVALLMAALIVVTAGMWQRAERALPVDSSPALASQTSSAGVVAESQEMPTDAGTDEHAEEAAHDEDDDHAADEHEAEAAHDEGDDHAADAHDEAGEGHSAAAHGIPADAAAVPNPVAADAASVAAGEAVFTASCAVCHGQTGLGDGAAGAALDPPPANLHEDHVQALSDGALFYTIHNGVEGTAMPAWGANLGEGDIWNVVNFIRTYKE